MVCIYVGKDVIKMVSGKNVKGKIQIDKEAYIDLPDARYMVEEGDDEKVKEKIAEFLLNSGDKNVTFVMDNTSIIMRDMELPKAPIGDFEKMIKAQMEQIIPNIDDYVLDYKINEVYKKKVAVEEEASKKKVAKAAKAKKETPDKKEDSKDKKTVAKEEPKEVKKEAKVQEENNEIEVNKLSIFAYKKSYVENYLKLAKSVKAKLQIIDATPNAISKLIATSGKTLGIAPFILIDLEESHINMYLFYQKRNVLTQTINTKKNTMLLSGDSGAASNVDDITSNISRMLQYQSAAFANDRVAKIYMTGNISNILDIQRATMTNFHIDVDVFPNIDSIKSEKSFDLRKYSNMVGALVRLK